MGGADVNLPKLKAYTEKLAELTQQVSARKHTLDQSIDQIRTIWDDAFFQAYVNQYRDLGDSLGSFLRDSERIQESLRKQITALTRYLG